MSAVAELQARREARESAVSKADIRRSFGASSERDRARSAAYEAGQAGRDIPFSGEDDELYGLYEAGQHDAEAARGDGGRSARPGSRGSRGSSRRVPRVPAKVRRALGARSAAAVVGGQSPSFLQLLGFAILLTALYLVLTNAKAVTTAVNGVRTALLWFIDPHATIGGK